MMIDKLKKDRLNDWLNILHQLESAHHPKNLKLQQTKKKVRLKKELKSIHKFVHTHICMF